MIVRCKKAIKCTIPITSKQFLSGITLNYYFGKHLLDYFFDIVKKLDIFV